MPFRYRSTAPGITIRSVCLLPFTHLRHLGHGLDADPRHGIQEGLFCRVIQLGQRIEGMDADATAAIFIKVLQLFHCTFGQLPDTRLQLTCQVQIDLDVIIQPREHGLRRFAQGITPLGRQIEPVVDERRRLC